MALLSTVFAQIDLKPEAAGSVTGLTIESIVSWAVTAVLVVAAVIFFFMLIFGGIRWIMSGGDKANTEAARNQVTAAIIGLIIVFSAWAIMALISSVFGISIFEDLSFGAIDVG